MAAILPGPHGGDDDSGRLPPQDLDAEEATLASILLDPENLPKIRGLPLGVQDFYRAYHQEIYRAILAIDARGQIPDIISVNDELRLLGVKDAGAYPEISLSMICEDHPLSYKGPEYAGIVLGLSYKRQVMETATRWLEDVYDPSVGPQKLFMRVQAAAVPLCSIEGVSGWDEAPDLDEAPRAMPFPLHALPAGLVEMAREAARLYPCPPDYVAVPALTVAGGMIGRSLGLKIKDDWRELGCLYSTVVGGPGTAKSPAMVLVCKPVWAIHEDLMEAHKSESDRIREDNRLAKAVMGAKDCVPLPMPTLKSIVTSDVTAEALAVMLRDNPRGVLQIHDEMSAWINSFGQYKGGAGNDRDVYLKLWNGTPIRIDRKGQEDGIPIYVSHPFMGLTGLTTPSKVRVMPLEKGQKKADDDGFMDRCLFSLADEIPMTWSWDIVPDCVTADWMEVCKRLYERPMAADDLGKPRPYWKPLSGHAQKAWESWILGHIKETHASDFPAYLRGPWSKFRAHCARLVLILDQLWWAYDPFASDGLGPVGAESVERAGELVAYFKSHYRRMLGLVEGARADSVDGRAVLEWAIGRGKLQFKASHARDNLRRRFAEKPDDFLAAIAWLEERHCIRRVHELRVNPKSLGTYQLHPKIPMGARAARAASLS